MLSYVGSCPKLIVLIESIVLGVQLCFRRLSIDGCSGKCWSK